MQMYLLQIAQTIVNGGRSMLGDGSIGEGSIEDVAKGADGKFYNKVFQPIIDVLDALLVPILILVGTAGSIYAIVLGVNFSRAESADKREEAKKRMINAVIGLVVTVILLILLKMFTSNAENIVEWINGFGADKTPAA